MPTRVTSLCCWTSLFVFAAVPVRGLAQSYEQSSEQTGPQWSLPRLPVDYGIVLGSGGLVFFHDRALDSDSFPVRPAVALGPGRRFLFQYDRQMAQLITGWRLRSHVQISKRGRARFFGFGNETSRRNASANFFRVDQTQYELGASLTHSAADGRIRLSVGPVFRYTTSEDSPEHFGEQGDEDARLLSVTRPLGSGNFGQFGVSTEIRVGTSSSDGSKGFGITARASVFPALLSVDAPFAKFEGEFRGGLRVPLPAKPALTMRVGGARVVGDFPFFEGAALGGSHTLRGFSYDRFVGDASVYAGADLRFPLGQLRALGRSATYGVMALTDAGRVYVDGQSPGGWHLDGGGGIWFQPSRSRAALQLVLVNSVEGTRLSGRFALPFD